MNATKLLSMQLEGGRHWLTSLLNDLEGEDTVKQPTDKGGNHALWVIGHIAVAESGILHGYVMGTESPLSDMNAKFGPGSTPTANVADYPSKEELLGKLDQARQDTLKYLAGISDDVLDEPSSKPDDPMFGKKGSCLGILVSHQAFHTGQVADCRRVLGKKPVMG